MWAWLYHLNLACENRLKECKKIRASLEQAIDGGKARGMNDKLAELKSKLLALETLKGKSSSMIEYSVS